MFMNGWVQIYIVLTYKALILKPVKDHQKTISKLRPRKDQIHVKTIFPQISCFQLINKKCS